MAPYSYGLYSYGLYITIYRFVDQQSGHPVVMESVYITLIDVGQSSSGVEFVEASGFQSYLVMRDDGQVLYTYGLHSYGPYSYGPYSYGPI